MWTVVGELMLTTIMVSASLDSTFHLFPWADGARCGLPGSLFIEVFLLFVSGLLPVVVLSYGAYSRSDVMVISLGRN